MESIVQDHEKRILALEQNYSEVKKEMTAVQTSQLEIKGTLLRESQEQKSMIANQTKDQGELLNRLISHTLGIKKTNNAKKWELALAVGGGLVGGGGIILFVLEAWFK